MAAWTQADLDKLRAARLALASGEAVQTVRYDGPPSRMVTYQPADAAAMQRLEAEIQSELSAASGKVTTRFASVWKGL